VSELASTLTLLKVGDGHLEATHVQSTLPPDFAGESLGGHLAISGTGERIYVTNRGHDSIGVFALQEGNRLMPLQHVPSSGASPRFFLLLEEERRLVVANEVGCTVSIFAILADGRLVPLDEPFPLAGAAFVMAQAAPPRPSKAALL
jgi:6-phosphogluconolactonase